MTSTRIPSTAFADAWIHVDGTEDPGFFVKLLDSTRAELLERARRSPAEFFAPQAIRNVCREFIVLCRRLDLFSEAIVAIDGSKFKAVNNRDKNFTEHKLKKRMAQLEESIGRYLAELDRADREPTLVTEGRASRLKEKVATVKAHTEHLKQIGQQLREAPDGQVSLTDPDARSMATSGRGTGIVGYNVQTAVDTKHHLIVAHEVTNVGHDRSQLFSMASEPEGARYVAEHSEVVARYTEWG